MTDRIPARSQRLPTAESEFLAQLDQTRLRQRISLLYRQGWTLDAIGQALAPPRPRSTVRVWVTKYLDHAQHDAPRTDPPLPRPTPPQPNSKTHIARPRVVSPGIPAPAIERIAHLAPIARKFRAGMASMTAAALANSELTHITASLHATGVPVRELANAAGVTYRAMARRLGKTKGNTNTK